MKILEATVSLYVSTLAPDLFARALFSEGSRKNTDCFAVYIQYCILQYTQSQNRGADPLSRIRAGYGFEIPCQYILRGH